MPNAEQQTGPTLRTGPRAWLPLGFVVGSLLLLLITPFVANRRIASIREDLVDLTNEARILVSEFEGAFAEELVIGSAGPDGRVAADSGRTRAIAREQATTAPLNAAVSRIGGRSVTCLRVLRAAESEWRALNPVEGFFVLSEATRDRRTVVGRQVIDAAEALHQQLIVESDRGIESVRHLERIDMLLSAVLASIALIAMAIVVTLERRVRAFAAEADDRARKLERSIELRASLINGVVHDVKNPLGAASGYADLLEEGVVGPMNERQSEMIGRIKRLIGTAQQTVAEMVELARVEAVELTIEWRNTNLVGSIRRIVDDHQAQAMRKSITLSFTAAVESLWMQTDAARLRHVVENLLSNALKYTPSGGKITVSLSVEPGEPSKARIVVRDNGPGVPVELRERIFDPFYRIPTSEHRIQGTGLGLAISRRITGLLGGSLIVTDAPGGGSDFVLTLPMDQQENSNDSKDGTDHW